MKRAFLTTVALLALACPAAAQTAEPVAGPLGARSLGLDRDLGSLEVGKLADMVVLEQNPLDNIRNTTSIAYTIANGRVYDQDMNEVAPRQRARAPFWFAGAGGEGVAASAAETDTHGHD